MAYLHSISTYGLYGVIKNFRRGNMKSYEERKAIINDILFGQAPMLMKH